MALLQLAKHALTAPATLSLEANQSMIALVTLDTFGFQVGRPVNSVAWVRTKTRSATVPARLVLPIARLSLEAMRSVTVIAMRDTLGQTVGLARLVRQTLSKPPVVLRRVQAALPTPCPQAVVMMSATVSVMLGTLDLMAVHALLV